jgi:hypothetical protein
MRMSRVPGPGRAEETTASRVDTKMRPPPEEVTPVIELASLPQRHPIGDALLIQFGALVVLRLGWDPVQVPAGTLRRRVTVDRLSPPAPGTRSQEVREVSWCDLPLYSENYLIRVGRSVPERSITEGAAIGVMALLIHELEGVILQEVLVIGSGGDYLASFKGGAPFQVEVSGIRDEGRAGAAADRLKQKLKQVLSKSPQGYASVTTFRRTGDSTAHSYLHYAERPKPEKGRKK